MTRLMTNKWVLGLGAAVLFGLMSSVALADPPRHGGDGYRGGHDGGRAVYVNHDRDGGRGRGFASSWGSGRGQFSRPVYVVPPVYRPAVVTYGGYGSGYGSGCVVAGGYRVTPGVRITIIVR